MRDPEAHIENKVSTVVVFASGGHPAAKFGSQDVAAMTNHHLLLIIFLSDVLFSRGAVRATKNQKKKKKKWASMNDLTGNSS